VTTGIHPGNTADYSEETINGQDFPVRPCFVCLPSPHDDVLAGKIDLVLDSKDHYQNSKFDLLSAETDYRCPASKPAQCREFGLWVIRLIRSLNRWKPNRGDFMITQNVPWQLPKGRGVAILPLRLKQNNGFSASIWDGAGLCSGWLTSGDGKI